MSDVPTSEHLTGLEIAIIGMEARLPGADTLSEFWANLCNGTESLTTFSDDELKARGVPADLRNAPDFVPVGAPLDGQDTFDAAFFGFSPNEAEILDPQHRLFLECAWNALENAGYAPNKYDGAIGVYAAAGMNGYLHNLYGNAHIRSTVTPYEIFTSNDKDFLATRTSYKLNLRGPGITVQTACSSSLVAVHLAAQSLIAGDCDMALAGGVSLSRQDGYRALEGSILSADGHCRAFDKNANGTVTGNGLGVVVLKRLEDALADGDHIDAVIKGSAINNDGSDKASYTAPQVDSQAEVIAAAQAAAEVSPADISYVEAHGTGTNLGDPIEIAALTQAFRRDTDRVGFCAIGSVKTNIGHLDTAAGIVGLIKTALMLRHRQIPATLHFSAPNPRIDFADSPFVVNTTLRDWECDIQRRAGVSSFGIGGTNAHVVLEEAPVPAIPGRSTALHLLTLSAKTKSALKNRASMLADELTNSDLSLSDVAHTLRVGREDFGHRQSVVASTREEATEALRALTSFNATATDMAAPVLLFPGQGSQSPKMMRDLYEMVPTFRAAFDDCCKVLDVLFGTCFRTKVFAADEAIHQTSIAQPALFVVEYALAQVWLELGLKPHALHGHSLGEYVAATLAGVFDLDSALRLVFERGRLMQLAQPGAMTAVLHGDTDISDLVTSDLVVAARNAPGLTVLSGPFSHVDAAETALKDREIPFRRLQTSHAFHSPMMDDAARAFEKIVAQLHLNAPKIPMISNLSGTWLSEEQATDAAYWARHLREAVEFGAGSATLLALQNPIFVECGPGSTLCNLTKQQDDAVTIEDIDTLPDLLAAVGQGWQAGLDLDWSSLIPGDPKRVALPGYPFDRQRYWVDADQGVVSQPFASEDLSDWIYTPSWSRTALTAEAPRGRASWLIYDDGHIGATLAQHIERSGADAYRVVAGTEFDEPEYRCFALPDTLDGSDTQLLSTLQDRGVEPEHIVFFWALNDATSAPQRLQALIETLAANPRPMQLTVVTQGATDVTGVETLNPAQARIHGITMVAGQEYPWLGCRSVDLDPQESDKPAVVAGWLHLALATSQHPALARRARHAWSLNFARQSLPARDSQTRLRRKGVFVVIGHLAEGFGRVWVDGLATERGARIAVIEDTTATPLSLHDGIHHQTADCTDADALRSALDAVVAHYGRVDGVFLSVALSNSHVTAPLALLGETQWHNASTMGIAPLTALANAIEGRKIGFVCVQSSLSAIVGGMGLSAYAGAHYFTDAFVADQDRTSSADWFAINWDALKTDLSEGAIPGQSVLQDNALSDDQAWDATRRILETGLTGQTIVSRGDLMARRAQWLNPTPKLEQAEDVDTGRDRPDIDTPFIAPRTQIEATVAGVLQDILGIDEIGVNDGFFELGGHSLMAIRATAMLRDAFPVQVEMRELLYENPSAASIARVIESKLPKADELSVMQALLDDVENLSDADIEAALADTAAQ